MGRKRYFNGSDYEEVEVIEVNGNLTLIQKDDYSQDWVANFEVDD